jgi:hypothetical protein
MDRKRRSEEKARRLQFRREMRAKGLDPDTVDAEGNPLPVRDDLEGDAAELAGEAGEDVASDGEADTDAVPAPAADRSKP